MPKLGLRPFSVIAEGAEAYFGYNFTRLENVFEHMTDVKASFSIVTGSLTIDTGLANLDGASASLESTPSANAAYVKVVVASATSITITVYTSAFGVSVVPATVRWIAVGELILA